MIYAFFLMSRHGRSRLTKWYSEAMTQREKQRFLKELNQIVLTRKPDMCNFLDFRDYKVVYKKYASLYFIVVVDREDNELLMLELIHNFVEILDKHFSNVCELDLIFKFHQTYFILDEVILAGYVQTKEVRSILATL
jgi:AP-1 complex subunit sigma 1/2